MLSRDNHLNYAVNNLRRQPILMDDLRKVLYLPIAIPNSISRHEYQRAVNQTVLFFNTFTQNAGIELIFLLTDTRFHSYLKSIMKAIGIWDKEYDEDFYKKIMEEIE